MIFVAMLLCVFMASAAMAFVVTNRSAEMDDFSPCDRAGTIEMAMTQSDWDQIIAYLGANDYARIRIALNGLSLPPSPTLPTLCVSIVGTVDGSGLGALGGDIPDDMVALQTIGVEVSDVDGDSTADITAYVRGTAGNQYMEVFITGLDPGADADFSLTPPWFKIGLYDELIDAGDVETTPICAQVLSFSGVSTLTISNEANPNTITFSGDNEIGHFLTMTTMVRDCDKLELVSCPDTATIELCPLGSVQGECPTYYKCFTIEGDIPESGDIQIAIRTNGANATANDQEGVYLQADPSVVDESGNPVIPTAAWVYYTSSGSAVTGMPCTIWEAEYALATFDAADFEAAGNEIRVCLPYVVNPDEAVSGTDVVFWISAGQLPCGSIVSGSVIGATLMECGAGGSYCIYFPYVLTDALPWQVGIAIMNMGLTPDPTTMEITMTLTDSTGATFTYTKNDFTTVHWATMLDSIVANFSGVPAAGPAVLTITGNYQMDGYHFATDGVFGAGTLARMCSGY